MGTVGPKKTAAKARGADTREAILEAASNLLGLNGYRGTSIAAVAAKVGVTDAGVLYHFPTKDALLLAVLARQRESYLKALEASIEIGGRAAIEGIGSWGHVMEADRPMIALYVTLSAEHLGPGTAGHEFFAERQAHLLSAWTRMFQQAIDEGSLRPDVDPAREASALMAYLDGIRLQWFFGEGTVALAEEVERHVADLLQRLAA